MGDPKKMQFAAHLAWLAETQRRNRETFGGWFMEAAGGSGDGAGAGGDAGGANGGDAGAGDGADTGAGGGASGGDGSGGKPPWGDDAEFNPAKAWDLIQNLRKEKAPNADLQAELDTLKATQQTQLDAIAKALGLKSDDTPPNPAKLAEQITAEQGKTAEAETRATVAERKLGVVLAALEHDGNYTALLDSTSFLDSVKDIDSTDSAAIGEAVKKAVTDNDHFKASPTAPPFPGGPRKTAGKPETGPGLPRLRDAYAQSSK